MNFWRGVFAFAAFFNIAVGAGLCVAPAQTSAGLGLTGPGAVFAIIMIGMLIAVFGVGYAIVAAAPGANRGIVWIGMIGKAGAIALGATQFAAGLIPASTFALSLGDVVFASLFALFLWRGPRP